MKDTTSELEMTGGAGESLYLQVLKRQLHASPTNPRKDFPEAGIEEMRASVAKHGVIQPLIVRRWPEKDRGGEDAYEVVCGERRFRGASRVEGLERIPVIVRSLTDTEVLEIQLIENLQREDVSPYDEAVGYAALLELRDAEGAELYTVVRIAEKIGKHVNYVRNRLKMQRTPKVLLEALRRGEVTTRVCEMVGRIPHAEDRERCAAEILKAQRYDRAMTNEETQEHIRESFMIALAKAPFDRKSVDLLPKAGSCEACPFRTGNDPDLAEDLATGLVGKGRGSKSGIDPQICQNPKCYRDKCEAHVARVKAATPELVLSDAEAKAVFTEYGRISHNSKLQLASEKPGYSDVGHWDTGKLKPWGDYAKKLGVPLKLAKNPRTGMLEQLVEVAAVKAAERQAGPEKPVFLQKGAGSKSRDEEKKAQVQEKRRREIEAEEIRIAFDQVSGVLVGNVSRPELLMILGQAVDHQGIDTLLRWMDLKPGSPPKGSEWQPARAHKIAAIVKRVDEQPDLYDREAILILILMAQFAEAVSYQGLKAPRFAEFAKIRGVDFKEVKTLAKARVKERRDAAKAAKAGKATKAAKPPVSGGAVSGEEVSGELTQRGAFQVNEHSMVMNPEVVELVAVKKFTATAKMASIEGRFYVGWSFNSPKASSISPCSVEGAPEDFASGAEALDDVAYRAWSFFKACEQNGEKVPAAVFAKLEEYRLKPGMAGQKEAEPTAPDATQQLAEDVATVVRHYGRIAGTASVDSVKITKDLGMPMDRAVGVINELRGRRMIVMGCLDRDSASVKEILGAEDVKAPVSAKVTGSGKSKLSAAAKNVPPKRGEPSASWLQRLELDEWNKLYAKLEKTLKAWEPDTTIFDAAWMRAWVKGVKDDATARILLEEAVHRGAIPAESVVMPG